MSYLSRLTNKATYFLLNWLGRRSSGRRLKTKWLCCLRGILNWWRNGPLLDFLHNIQNAISCCIIGAKSCRRCVSQAGYPWRSDSPEIDYAIGTQLGERAARLSRLTLQKRDARARVALSVSDTLTCLLAINPRYFRSFASRIRSSDLVLYHQ